ncbi:conserved hypothetical protein [Ricinus communis]|uniref:Uncharacterized protein n=1 Tax=Ricinus communis TaxID=3988 RepID=B9SWL7_RICCO|nr:conserved hypothetical protein [Ricinus communis]
MTWAVKVIIILGPMDKLGSTISKKDWIDRPNANKRNKRKKAFKFEAIWLQDESCSKQLKIWESEHFGPCFQGARAM